MLIVRWNEDKEGCLQARWFDGERTEHGDFVENVVHIDDYLLLREERCAIGAADEDEDCEAEALERPRFALAGCR